MGMKFSFSGSVFFKVCSRLKMNAIKRLVPKESERCSTCIFFLFFVIKERRENGIFRLSMAWKTAFEPNIAYVF